jgi:hypothetical protein
MIKAPSKGTVIQTAAISSAVHTPPPPARFPDAEYRMMYRMYGYTFCGRNIEHV